MSQLELVKTVNNGKLFKDASGQRFILVENVRFSHPYFGTPGEDENDDGVKVKKWRGTGMLNKETHGEIHALIEQVIKKIITENDAKVPADKWFMTDGDDKEDELMSGHWLISASDGRIPPTMRDANGRKLPRENEADIARIDEMFVGGYWGHMLIRPWFFSGKTKNSTKTYPKRVSAGLTGVMFDKKDKTFGAGRIDDTDAWGGMKGTEAEPDDGFGGAGGSAEDDDI